MALDRKVFSWALYDWANSAFATTVMAGFFPVFFKEFWSAGADTSASTFQLGMTNSLAGVITAALAPALGAIADKGSARKKFLIFFACMGIVMTGSLYFVQKGHWETAALIYVLALVGFSCGNLFYDSLIVDVASEARMHFVSALGYSLGYLGGGLLFAFNVLTTLKPHLFGLAGPADAVRLSFICTAVWWAVFSIPLLLFVKEPTGADKLSPLSTVKAGFRQLASTFGKVKRLRVVLLFLVSYWLYIDGVDTIIRMAVDYGMSLGFSSKSLIMALLITQFVGFPSAIAFGRIGERLGAKTGIFICVGVYLFITIWGYYLDREAEFYILAVIVGMVQGGVQALSRSFYAGIIPKNLAGEFFGFYNMLGKLAVIFGPALMGWVSVITGNPRSGILSVSVLFLAGIAVLRFVDEGRGRALAEQMEESGDRDPRR